jgi:hypothetical protein
MYTAAAPRERGEPLIYIYYCICAYIHTLLYIYYSICLRLHIDFIGERAERKKVSYIYTTAYVIYIYILLYVSTYTHTLQYIHLSICILLYMFAELNAEVIRTKKKRANCHHTIKRESAACQQLMSISVSCQLSVSRLSLSQSAAD